MYMWDFLMHVEENGVKYTDSGNGNNVGGVQRICSGCLCDKYSVKESRHHDMSLLNWQIWFKSYLYHGAVEFSILDWSEGVV